MSMIYHYPKHNITVRPAQPDEAQLVQKLNILAFKDRGKEITWFDEQILANQCPKNINQSALCDISYAKFFIAEIPKVICNDYPLQTDTGQYALGYIEINYDARNPEINYIQGLFTRGNKGVPAGSALVHTGMHYMKQQPTKPRKIKLESLDYAYNWYCALGYKPAPYEKKLQLLHSQFQYTMQLLEKRLNIANNLLTLTL